MNGNTKIENIYNGDILELLQFFGLKNYSDAKKFIKPLLNVNVNQKILFIDNNNNIKYVRVNKLLRRI